MHERATRATRSRFLTLLAALLVTVGLTVVPGAPARAVGCYGSGCAGKDPSAMGCASDGYTVTYVFVDRLGYMENLELRYSPACNANWSRLTARTYNAAWVSMCVTNYNNRNDTQCTGSFRNNYKWSPMIDGSKTVFSSVGYALDSGGAGNAATNAY